MFKNTKHKMATILASRAAHEFKKLNESPGFDRKTCDRGFRYFKYSLLLATPDERRYVSKAIKEVVNQHE